MKRNLWKTLLSVVLLLTMLVSMLPFAAFAEDDQTANTQTEEAANTDGVDVPKVEENTGDAPKDDDKAGAAKTDEKSGAAAKDAPKDESKGTPKDDAAKDETKDAPKDDAAKDESKDAVKDNTNGDTENPPMGDTEDPDKQIATLEADDPQLAELAMERVKVTYKSHYPDGNDAADETWMQPVEFPFVTAAASLFAPPAGMKFDVWVDDSGKPYPASRDVGNISSDLVLYATWVPDWSGLAISVTAPTSAKPGDAINYTITVNNDMGVSLTSVTVSDVLPAGVTYDSTVGASGTGWSISYNDGTVEATISALDRGDFAQFTIPVKINKAVFTSIENSAAITLASAIFGNVLELDTKEAFRDGIITSSTVKTDMAGLDISVSVKPKEQTVGQPITYTVTFTNNTGIALTSFTIQNVLEGSQSLATPSCNPPSGKYSPGGRDGDFYGDQLADGNHVSYDITTNFIRVNDTNNSATLKAVIAEISGVRGTFGSAEATATLKVIDWSNLKIEKTVDKATANSGDTLTYTIKVKNETGYDLSYLCVEDPAPENTTFVEGSQTSGNWNLSGGDTGTAKAELTYGLAKDAEETFTMKVKVNDDAPSGKVENTVTITEANSAYGTMPKGVGNSDTAKTVVTNNNPGPALSGLTISVTPSTSTADIGQSFTYTVTVTNKTGVDLESLYVYNTPPEGFSCSRDTDLNNPGNLWMNSRSDDLNRLLYLGNSGKLKNGDSAFYIIETQFPADTTVTTAVNKAAISEVKLEGGQLVNSGLPNASATVTLKQPDWSGLTITKEVNKATAKPGETLLYTITVENNTGVALKEVKFTDELPTNKVAYGALGNDNGNKIESDESKSIITGTANNLADNGKATFTIGVQVLDKVNTAVENTAYIFSAASVSGFEINKEELAGKRVTVSTDILTGDVPVSVKVLFNGLKDVSQVPANYTLTGADSNIFPKGDLKGNIALGTAVKDASGQISRTFTTTADVILGKEYSLSFTQSGYDVTGYVCNATAEVSTTVTADAKTGVAVTITLNYVKENLVKYPSVTVRTYFKGLTKLPDNFGYALTCTSAPEEATAFLTKNPLTVTKSGVENGVPYLDFTATDVTLQAGTELTFSFDQSGYDVPGYVCALGLSTFKFNLERPTTDILKPIQMNITNTYTQPDWNKLTITKAADKTRAMPGSVVKYTVTVTNNTGVDLSNIVIADKLDSDLRYSDSTGDYSTGTGTWTVASLANGKSVALTLTVKLKYALAAGTVIDNTATVTSAVAGSQTYDLSSQKISDSVSVTVTSGKGSPRTGDESNLGLWIAVMAASLVCAGAAAVIYKKRRG